MRIGLVSMGRVKKFKNQWIETQFFVLGIPLFPVKSMFVTKSDPKNRQGFDIDLNKKSILKGYFSFVFLILGLFMLFAGNGVLGGKYYSTLGLLLLGVSIYLFFIYGESTQKENEIRNLFQNAVGINALPEYLDRLTVMKLRNAIIADIKEYVNDQGLNWIELVERKKYDKKLLPSLFAAMGYHSRLEEKDKFYRLFEGLKREYKNILNNTSDRKY